MIMKTLKRKLQPESSDLSPGGSGTQAWERQRQFVFSVSLHKYQRDQELPEPSLRRSVLISNTLRQVEACRVASLDLQAPLPSPHSHQPHDQPIANGTNDLPSPAKCQRLTSHRTLSEEAEDWCSLSTDPDFTISPTVSTILTGLESSLDASVPLSSPRAALRSLENLKACPDAGGFWLRQQVRGAQGQDLMEWEFGVEAARSSYLKDVTAEDMFQDIDTSQLERDMGILGLRSDGCLPGVDLPYHSAKGLPSFSPHSAHHHPPSGTDWIWST